MRNLKRQPSLRAPSVARKNNPLSDESEREVHVARCAQSAKRWANHSSERAPCTGLIVSGHKSRQSSSSPLKFRASIRHARTASVTCNTRPARLISFRCNGPTRQQLRRLAICCENRDRTHCFHETPSRPLRSTQGSSL